MGRQLVLAEKPSVGRELARVLGCRRGGEGYLEGDRYVVTWALGHLVTLADPDVYEKKWEKWDMADLPMLPQHRKLVVIPQTARQFRVVQGLMKRSDITGLIIATDAGREGELVARWIMAKAGWNKPAKRPGSRPRQTRPSATALQICARRRTMKICSAPRRRAARPTGSSA